MQTGKDEAFAEALGREIAAKIAELTRYPFVTAPDKFAARGSLDAMSRRRRRRSGSRLR